MNTKSKSQILAKKMASNQTISDFQKLNHIFSTEERESFLRSLSPERVVLVILSVCAAQYLVRQIADQLKRD